MTESVALFDQVQSNWQSGNNVESWPQSLNTRGLLQDRTWGLHNPEHLVARTRRATTAVELHENKDGPDAAQVDGDFRSIVETRVMHGNFGLVERVVHAYVRGR